MMKRFILAALSLVVAHGFSLAQDQSNLSYPSDPDTQVQPGVTQGEVLHFTLDDSKIYPGTQREYWVYVPAQYDPAQPACLFFDLDGVQFNAPVVFDNLIHKKEIPVTIGVFVGSGTVIDSAGFPVRYNRSFEFDAVNDDFVRFIETELLPDVELKKASDGRPIRISRNGKDRAIAGCSSGGIGAFTAAWERPDLFSRVYSCIGTFVGMRGGDRYPVLIRKTEPKPIRVFLQDGSKDTWNPLFGSWFKGNLDMEAALSFAGYEVGHAWGEGGHDGVQGTAIFPDVIRWLWRGWPNPVGGGQSGNDMQRSILIPGETWVSIDSSYRSVKAVAADRQGDVYFSDSLSRSVCRLDSAGTVVPFVADAAPYDGLAVAKDGRLLAFGSGKTGITAYGPEGKPSQMLKKIRPSGLFAVADGNLYVAEAGAGREPGGTIGLLRADGDWGKVADGLNAPSALAMSPDRKLLFACDRQSHWIYGYLVGPDGSLRYGQRFYWLHVSESNDGTPNSSGASAMAVDRDGNLYVATRMGVQVADRNGRVRAILTLPEGGVTSLCFGGAGFDTLYIVCDGRLYKRKMKLPGVPPLAEPFELSPGGAG